MTFVRVPVIRRYMAQFAISAGTGMLYTVQVRGAISGEAIGDIWVCVQQCASIQVYWV